MGPIKHSIEQRIQDLERRLRRATVAAFGALGLLVGCVALSATRQDAGAIRARSIQVVDSAGRVRIILDSELMGPDIAGIRVRDADGGSVAELWAGRFDMEDGRSTHGAVVNLEADFDDDSDCSITRLVAAGEGANVSLNCGDARQTSMEVTSTGSSVKLGTGRPSSYEEDGETVITTEWQPSIALSENDGQSSIVVSDADGAKRFEAP